MADDEKEDPTESDAEDGGEGTDERDSVTELEDEITRLEDRITELEEELDKRGSDSSDSSGAATWAGWILGTLVGATSLVLVVILLGGGWPGECDCSESSGSGDGPAAQQQQQASLERLLRRNSSDFQDCFEGWASQNSEQLRQGWSVVVRLEIEASDEGEVQRVEASGEGLPQPLGDCLEQRVRRWEFPGAGPYTMELPFAFEARPQAAASGGDAGAPTAGDGSPATTDASN